MISFERPFVVGLSGPTCTGKSTLGALIGKMPNTVFVPEPDPSALLIRMLEGKGIKAADIQDSIVRERHRLIRDAVHKATSDQIVLIDRVLSEDREVFFRLHHQIGLIDDAELMRLDDLVGVLREDVVEPDLVIFLSADEKTLQARLPKRPEGAWLLEHLGLQLTLYREYRKRLEVSAQSMLSVDTSGLGRDRLSEQSQVCWDGIATMRSFQRATRAENAPR